MLLNDFLRKSTELQPEKVALIYRDKRITYTGIDEASNSLGNALILEGFKRHDRAIIYLDNSTESIISIFAVLKAGGVFIPISPQVKLNKFGHMINDCKPRLLITNKDNLAKISGNISNFKELKWIIYINDGNFDTETVRTINTGILSYEDILEHSPRTIIEQRCIDVDLASLIYTSGSSGSPKCVMLNHLNMVSAATSVISYLGNTSSDVIMNALPLSFSYGLYQVLMSFKFGGTVVVEKSFTYPQKIIEQVIAERVTGWPMVPSMIAILFKLINLKKYDFPDLKYITSAGQVLPRAHAAMLRDSFPKTKIYSMYGLTECKRVSYLDPAKIDEKPDSVGKAMPNVETYIVDSNGKEITRAREPGELVVRGSNVMQGYWNLPHETEKVLRQGRYPTEKVLYTGDIFEKDEEGYLYFLGRKDDIIMTGGLKVSPKEVENVLCEKAGVIEAAVIGVEDEILGNVIKAFVVLENKSKVSSDEIFEYCLEHLERHAVPKYVSFCKTLPKTNTGKIIKRNLK